jgi:hypothetical protein
MIAAMSNREGEAIESVVEMLSALAQARKAMRETERDIRSALSKVDRGGDVASALIDMHPEESRHKVNDSLVHLDHCRHDMRVKLFALALEGGMTVDELSGVWGISLDLAARIAKEARGQGRQDRPGRPRRPDRPNRK